MKYSSVKTVESKTQPGARFVLKRMNERRRVALTESEAYATANAKMAPLFEEYSPLNREYGEAVAKAKAADAPARRAAIVAGYTEREALTLHPYGTVAFDAGKLKRWGELSDSIGKIERAESEPAALRFVVVRIEEFEVDGQEIATVDEFLECEGAPDEFRDEMLLEVKREMGLLPAEAQNLSLPSTSAAAVGGAKTTGSAAPAETTGTISDAAAGSSTGPESATVPSISGTP